VPRLNNVTTQDNYADATSLIGQGLVRVNLIVANASILYELADRWPPGSEWGEEKFLPPGMFSLERDCQGVRVRSAVAGVPAQVTVDALTDSELPNG
jgi:hypothetical protein